MHYQWAFSCKFCQTAHFWTHVAVSFRNMVLSVATWFEARLVKLDCVIVAPPLCCNPAPLPLPCHASIVSCHCLAILQRQRSFTWSLFQYVALPRNWQQVLFFSLLFCFCFCFLCCVPSFLLSFLWIGSSVKWENILQCGTDSKLRHELFHHYVMFMHGLAVMWTPLPNSGLVCWVSFVAALTSPPPPFVCVSVCIYWKSMFLTLALLKRSCAGSCSQHCLQKIIEKIIWFSFVAYFYL